MLVWLTYCLHLLTHSCTAFFFLVPWMCWFLSLLLGLCPRHCIISVFVFGSCGSGRYLRLDTNVNIIHPQVNNSNKIQGPETPPEWEGGLWNPALGAGPSPTSLPGTSHYQLHSVWLFRSCSPVLFWPINLNSASCFHLWKIPPQAACVWKCFQRGSRTQAWLRTTAELLGPRCPAFPGGMWVIKGPAYRPPWS